MPRIITYDFGANWTHSRGFHKPSLQRMEEFYARLQDDRPDITSVNEYEKCLRTDIFDLMKLYAQKHQAHEASLTAKIVADAEEEKKHLIARYEERERLLKLKHDTELVEAEKRGKEEALRQFNTLVKELEITYQLRVDDLNAAHAQEIDALQSQLLAAAAHSIEMRAASLLPTPLPMVPRTQYPHSSTADPSHQARSLRSPSAVSAPTTSGSSTNNTLASNTHSLSNHTTSTPSLRVVSATPSTNPELNEKLHSLEELLLQRKDLLLKQLQDHELPRTDADHAS